MIILPALAALTLYSEPAQPPSRLDPDDIEALSALLEALAAGETPPGQPPAEPAAEDIEPDAAATEEEGADAQGDDGDAGNESDDADEAEGSDLSDTESAEPHADDDDAPAEPGGDAPPAAGEEDSVPASAPDDGHAPGSEVLEPATPPADAEEDIAPEEAEADAAEDMSTPDPASPPSAAPERSFSAMGPHVGAGAYEAVRGRPLGSGLTFTWSVTVRPLDDQGAILPAPDSNAGTGATTRQRHFTAGDGWAGERTETSLVLNDFSARRQLKFDREARSAVNSSLYAAARRNLDIYVFLSDGGQRQRISFGPDTEFDRFWLEAAMGVAASPAALTASRTPGDEGGQIINWYRGGDETAIASARYGACEASREPVPAAIRTHLLAGLGHTLAWHPQLIEAFHAQGDLPCAFSFVIISPDSPQGRVESWVLESVRTSNLNLANYAGFALALPEAELLDEPTMNTVLAAAGGELGEARAAPDFMGDIQALRQSGDYAGALLMLAQETANFGPCPAETIGSERLACAGAASLAQAGAGNARFERVMEATAAVEEGAHRVAIENLRDFITRDDLPGAAARTILANELLSMGAEGLQAYQDIDPVELLQDALVIDPFAPDGYWHLGRRYMEAGAPEAAWALFDLGRALPGRRATPLLNQVDRLEQNLEQLAPLLFGPPSQP